MTPNYAEWVGAWWLVYALGTCVSLLLCVVLYFVDMVRHRQRLLSSKPKQSISNPAYQIFHTSGMRPRTGSSVTNLSETLPEPPLADEPNGSLKSKDVCFDMIALTKQLLCNLCYMGVTSCAVIEALLIKGYLAFLSKHIEYQFRTTSSHSSIYMGIISLCSVIFGAPLGAYCVKRYEMNGRQCAKFCCIILALSSVIFLGLMLHCREPTIGLNGGRERRSSMAACF